MNVEIMIQKGGKVYYPKVSEGIKFTMERKGTPGILTFELVKESMIEFEEGNPVRLSVDGTNVFYGFIFTKKRDKEGTIAFTAYDQLRYLKNKDTYTYENKKASELLCMIAADFRLNCGVIEDTGFVIESGVEENQSLLDIIQNALDETLAARNTLFVLYDDCGKLTLRNVESMKLGLLIDAETGENFDYSSSIDRATYNKIKLAYDNKDTGKREIYLAQDSGRMDEWGVLQYFETIDKPQNGAAKVESLLSFYNQKTRTLTVKNAFGDIRVRAGSALAVQLNLGDTVIQRFMVAEKVTHTWSDKEHFMDLALIGGEFIA